jgi:hypothetical protein
MILTDKFIIRLESPDEIENDIIFQWEIWTFQKCINTRHCTVEELKYYIKEFHKEQEKE